MLTIALLNHKGGTGKTTSALSLSAAARELGENVLLVDLDPNAAATLSLLKDRCERTIADALRSHGESLISVIQAARESSEEKGRLDILPGGKALYAASLELAHASDRRLKSLLTACEHDVCFIDTAGSMSPLHKNAIVAADLTLCPASLDYVSIAGVQDFVRTIELFSESEGAIPFFILPTMHSRRPGERRDAEAVLRYFHEAYGDVDAGGRVLPPVPTSVYLRRARRTWQTVFETHPGSSGAEAYREAYQHLRRT